MTDATVANLDGPLNAARTFFTTIFSAAPAGTVVVLTTPPTWRVYAVPPDDPEAAVRRACRLSRLGADVYVHCGLQAAATAGSQPGRGRAEDVIVVVATWADLDVVKLGARRRYLPSRSAARRFLERVPISPTVLVWSGGGYHPWWVLKEPLVLDRAGARAEAERLVRRWQDYLRLQVSPCTLDSTHDLSRVLRVPGTINTKYGTSVVLEDASGPRVDPSDLEELCSQVPDVGPPAPAPAVRVGTLDPTAEPPRAKFAALCTRSPLFVRLWRRDISPKDASQSGYDFRLATLAAAAAWHDEEIAALLIAHRRAAGRPPHHPAYYARTLARVRGGS